MFSMIFFLNIITECFVDQFHMNLDGLKCTTPELWSMNGSMKRDEYQDCKNINDSHEIKNQIASMIYSDDFQKLCPGEQT